MAARITSVELGLHLPLMEFADEGQSLARLTAAVDAARDCGFAAVSANDHFVFPTPWLDGPTALAAVIERSGSMELATTVALAGLRGPVALAKALAAVDVLSGGRVVAGIGPGSSARDYEALGVPFDERWRRFDEAAASLRELLQGDELKPSPPRGGIPLWIGSWGSEAGLRRVARLGDGWLASAYNTSPDGFAAARTSLDEKLRDRGRAAEASDFPNALVTMWTWVTEDASDRDRVLDRVLAPIVHRDPAELRDQVCIGPAGHCAELLTSYRDAGCRRVHVWPLGDEPRQVELLASSVVPLLG